MNLLFHARFYRFGHHAVRVFVRRGFSANSAALKHLPSERLPHVFQPKLLIGASVFTGSLLWYLWYFDDESPPTDYPKTFQATIIRRLPSNAYSHLIGAVGCIRIPPPLRGPLLGIYTKLTHCNMSEAKEPDIRKYETLGQLFSRELAPEARPIDRSALLNCPCDGTVVSLGPVDSTKKQPLEEVKGVSYSLGEFLGPMANLATSEGRRLYQCVIYLCPGDYHRFHSPTQWTLEMRRHFPGKLLSVRPAFLQRLPGVLTLNERVVYFGRWNHGFLSLAAVGAAGVGSVVPADGLDPALSTNKRAPKAEESKAPGQHFREATLGTPAGRKLVLEAGAPLGSFQMGSTVVLVFEAPWNGVKWTAKPGDKVKFGQALMVETTVEE